jgi:hypothetical protein
MPAQPPEQSADTAVQSYRFDDRNLQWLKLGDFEHFLLAMYDIDPKRKVIDFILKFAPNERSFLHRHLALTNTLVIQGEHRVYEPDGRLKEIRKVGSYTSSTPGEPHREGGGPEGAVVFYSVRAEGDELFDVLDNSGKLTGKLTMQDFADLLNQ